jgi:hypothetical protein
MDAALRNVFAEALARSKLDKLGVTGSSPVPAH